MQRGGGGPPMIRPLMARLNDATVEEHSLVAADGVRLGLTHIARPGQTKGAVILSHGLSVSTDTFVLPEVRNLVEVLLAAGYDPWLFDWRGSCRLPHNES